MDIDKMIKSELRRLKGIFKNVPENKLKLVDNLIKQAAWMGATLENLESEIDRIGYSVTGSQGPKKPPELDTYISLGKNYQSAIKQLQDVLDKSVGAESDESKELKSFLTKK